MPQGLDNFIGAVGDAIKTAPTFYEDALQPTIQETGKILALIPQTIEAALLPLRQWNIEREYKFAETKKLLEHKLENVDPEKIVTPETYVAVPAIQAISYSMDSIELRNLYANLLAKAMNSDTKDYVHPSYIETIKQLSPDDASYFKCICPLDFRPMIDVKLDFPDSSQLRLAGNANLFSTNKVKNFELAVDNLSRLGLINIPNGIWYGDDSLYKPLLDILEVNYTIEKFKSRYPNAIEISFDKKRIDITAYGQNFYNTCCT